MDDKVVGPYRLVYRCQRVAKVFYFHFQSNSPICFLGPKRGEVTSEWRKIYNEELNDLYSSPNIVWVIK